MGHKPPYEPPEIELDKWYRVAVISFTTSDCTGESIMPFQSCSLGSDIIAVIDICNSSGGASYMYVVRYGPFDTAEECAAS